VYYGLVIPKNKCIKKNDGGGHLSLGGVVRGLRNGELAGAEAMTRSFPF
jgi:hypothetical protein